MNVYRDFAPKTHFGHLAGAFWGQLWVPFRFNFSTFFSDAEFGPLLEDRLFCPFYICVYCDFAPEARFGRLDPFRGGLGGVPW